MERIEILDSHTEGEPTRVVMSGVPDLGPGPASRRADILAREHADFLRAVVTEPRGHDAVVGAVLLESEADEAIGQVIFFNNVGCLHMCVHGTIGVAATLAHLGRVGSGRHSLETPVGLVHFEILPDGRVAVENVPSRRTGVGVEVVTRHHGTLVGDVAWGGNWFFLIDAPDLSIDVSRVDALTQLTHDVRESLARQGTTGSDGLEIDHVELFGPPTHPDARSKNFVLCPGKAWDRSPCGTGTSAKAACLAAAGTLDAGQSFIQESTIGSTFEASYRMANEAEEKRCSIPGDGPLVVPTIRGRAWMMSEATLLRDPSDPFRSGLRT